MSFNWNQRVQTPKHYLYTTDIKAESVSIGLVFIFIFRKSEEIIAQLPAVGGGCCLFALLVFLAFVGDALTDFEGETERFREVVLLSFEVWSTDG